MFKPHMFESPSRSPVLSICFLIFSLAAQAQGPSVPVPVPPVKRPPQEKKTGACFPQSNAFLVCYDWAAVE